MLINPVLTRVDSRLVHGIVVENWANYLKATAIVVANDEIIMNGLRLAVLEMAVPSSIRLGIYSVKVATDKFIEGDFEKDRAILLFSNIKDACQAIQNGLRITSLNLGDYQCENGIIKVSDRVILGQKDLLFLRPILLAGISVYVQSLPSSRLMNITQLLQERMS